MGGAAALFELRGRQQLDHELGNVIFVQMRTQIVSGTLSPVHAHTTANVITGHWMHEKQNICSGGDH